MKNNRWIWLLIAVFFVSATKLIAAGSDTKDKTQMTPEQRAWKNAVIYGEELFNKKKMGTNGKSCSSANCHEDRSRLVGIGAEYPKYSKMANRVVTLGHMINFCIFGALKGKMLDLDSTKLIALKAYISVLK